MIKEFINSLKEMDKSVFKVVNYGFVFSSVVCLLGIVLLVTYNLHPNSYLVFTSGFLIVKAGLFFGVEFLVCGFVTDKYKKGLV